MLGAAPRLVSEPAAVDFSCPCQVSAAVDDVAVAPGPPPPGLPYVIVNLLPASRVRLAPGGVCQDAVLAWAAAGCGRALEVQYPAFARVRAGAPQRAGSTCETEPLLMPSVAAVRVTVVVRPVWHAETFVVGVVSVPEP